MKKNFLDTSLGVFLAAIFCNLLWGSASPCIKLGYELFSIDSGEVMGQILFAGLRFALAGILIIAFESLSKGTLITPPPGSGKQIVILAFAQTIIQYTFFYMGLSKAAAFKGSVISPANVFFAILFSSLVLRMEKLTIQKAIGCIIGFAGVILINLGKANATGFRLDGEGFLLIAAASYGFSSVLIKLFSQKVSPILLSSYQFLIGGFIMMFAALCLGGQLPVISPAGVALLLYLAFVSAVAYTIWSLLLQRHHVSHITIYCFTNPIFGVLLSSVLLGEGHLLDPLQCIASLALVGLGILIVNRR